MNHPQATSATRLLQQVWRVVSILLLIGLSGFCCLWTGVWTLVPPLRYAAANHLDRSQGEVELLAGAQWLVRGVRLSPDGRRMTLGWVRDGRRQAVIWDLSTEDYFRRPVDGDMRWLSAEQFVVVDEHQQFFLVDARTGAVTPAQLDPEPEQPSWQERILARWRAAEQVYSLYTFSQAGYTVISIEHGQPYVYRNYGRLTDADEQAFINQVPHIEVPSFARGGGIGTKQRLASPDGRFYVTIVGVDDGQELRILTQDGQLVGQALKAGWYPYVLGWAYDGSGVYFQLQGAGRQEAPLYKLSPQLAPPASPLAGASGVWWAIGIAVLAGIAGWLWRRR